MSPIEFAWRSMTRQRARAVLGIAGIATVSALLFDMLLLSRGLVVSFRDLLSGIGFDVRVTATASLPTMGPPIRDAAAAVAAVQALPEVEEVVPIRFGRAEIVRAGADGSETTFFQGCGPRRGHGWTLVEGEGLEVSPADGTPPILVNRYFAERERLSPGSTLVLRGACAEGPSALPPVAFRVTGIVRLPFEAEGDRSAMTTLDAFRRTCADQDPDAVDMLLVASRAGIGAATTVAAIERARSDLHPFSNAQFLERFERTNFSYFRQISYVLSSIAFFFAFLLVATLLTVSVNQRLGELAALRALGLPRLRIVADLFCEAALFVGIGGGLGLPAGLLLARRLDDVLRAMPGLPTALHFFVLEPRAVVLHLALLVLTAVLAGLYPAYLAARLPIAATLRRELVS